MNRKILTAFICLSIMATAQNLFAWSATAVASVDGVIYATVQEALDAATLCETPTDRVVLLLEDVDLGGDTLVAQACDVALNLNGHSITGMAESLIVLKDGARLVVTDGESGRGAIRTTYDGAGCAILLEGTASLVVDAGTVEAMGEGGVAVRCAADSTVSINGGNVGGIERAVDTMVIQNSHEQTVVQYDLTIGAPPLAGARVINLSTQPGLSHPYGLVVANGDGIVHVWLPEGQTRATVSVGCSIYSGEIRGEEPHEAVLTKVGTRHDFSGAWHSDDFEHWKVCENAECHVEAYRAPHTGGAATCTESAVCSVCGKVYGASLGHDFEAKFTVDVEPTCTTPGSKSRHCTRCGAVTDVTVIPATGHDFEAQYTVDVAPTCTIPGSKSRHCTRCGEVTDVTVIPATGHSFSQDWTSDEGGHWHAATCGHDVTDGYAVHTPALDDGDCTTAVLCSICGHVVIPAMGHVWGGWQTDANEHWKVCTNDGCTQEANRTAHTGGKATCTEPATCSVCGTTYGAPLGHDFEAKYTVDVEPTCTTPGSKSRHCTRCGAVTDVTVIPATGHSFSQDWTSDEGGHWHSATCGHDVIEGYAAHTPEPDDGDCTTPVLCSICGHVVVPATEHVWSGWQMDADEHWKVCTNDGCTQEANRTAHTPEPDDGDCTTPVLCSVCSHTVVAAKEHVWGGWQTDADDHWKVCTNDGCTQETNRAAHTPQPDDGDCTTPVLCSTCGHIVVPAMEHVWSGWQSDANEHWKVCTNGGCTQRANLAAHTGGTATCTEPAVCAVCGATYGAPLGHDFEAKYTVDVEPTCTTPGSKSRHCTRCGEVTDVTVIPATGHSFFPDWTSDDDGHWHASTCGHDVTDGYAAHTPEADDGDCTTPVLCSVCGHIVVPAMEHVWSGWQSDANEHWKVCTNGGCTQRANLAAHTGGEATCTEPATCSVCGEAYGAPLGHDFEVKYTVDVEPTCTTPGSKSRHCTRCGAVTDVTVIPATGHSFSQDWTSDEGGHWHAATCGHDVIDRYAAHTPEPDDGDCTTPVLCSVCGHVVVPAVEHVWSGWQSDANEHWKVCTNGGCTQRANLAAHTGGTATCTEPAVCAVCGATYGAPLGHDFEAKYTVDVEPTCTTPGSKSRHCTRCGEVTDVTVIPATGHSFSPDWTSDDDGHWHVATCGHDVTDGYAAHTPEPDDGDCTTPVLCSICGHVVVPAMEHVWSGWQSDANEHWKVCTNGGCTQRANLAAHTGGTATCTEPAVCAVCGATYGAPLGHDFEAKYTVDVEPTCTTPGSKSRHCTRCGEVTDVTVIPATGHSFSPDWTSDDGGHWHASTCGHDVTDGYAAHTPEPDDGDCTTPVLCSICGHVVVPAMEHVWSGWQSDANDHWQVCTNDGCTQEANRAAHTGGKATCTEPAVCSVCGEAYGTSLGHDFEAKYTVDVEPTCTTPGSKSRHCTRCGEVTDVTVIPATGHSFSPDWTSDDDGHWHASTCGHDVTDGYAAHTPEADDGDCTTPVLCSVCGHVVVPAKEHVWGGWQSDANDHWQVCTNDGCTQEANRAAHTGGEATCTEPAICAVCGETYGTPLGHSPADEYTIDEAPTCTEEGWEVLYCTRCGEMLDTRWIPATGHSFSSDWASDDDGHWHVATCGHDVTDGYAAHTPEADDGDCTTEVLCSVCGHVVVPAMEHVWSGWQSDANEHWQVCTNDGCTQEANRAAHTGGEATCTEPAVCSVCGEVYGTSLGHDFEVEYTVDVEPTCTSPGSKSRHCTRCGEVTDITVIPATGHSFSSDWTSDEGGHWHSATCGHDVIEGYAAHTPEPDDGDCTTEVLCSVCGHIVIPAREHVWGSVMSNATEHWYVCANEGCLQESSHEAHDGGTATCIEPAWCSVCGEAYGAPLGHSPADEYTVEEAPTCTEEGWEVLYCTRCGEILDTRWIPATGHRFSPDWSSDEDGHWHAATCGDDEIDGYADHTPEPDDGDCTTPVLCSVCGRVLVPAQGHVWSEWYSDADEHWQVCTNEGCLQEANRAPHTGVATCTEPAMCPVCGDFYGAPLGHDFEAEYTVDVEPTCTVPGSKSRHCTRCGATADVIAIPATGHDYPLTWTTVTAATCTTVGQEKRVCANDATHIETRAIPALGHNYATEYTIDVAPTCTAPGSKSRHCTRCGATTDVTAIPATGHDYPLTWTTVTAATCTTAGQEKRICANDATHIETRAIPALGHNYATAYTIDLAPTCTTPGSKSRHCTRCGATTDVTAIPATGHSYPPTWTTVTAATCTTAGQEKRICANDATHIETRAIPALGHSYATAYTIDRVPTCTVAGEKSYHCTRCDAKTGTVAIAIDPNAHNWNAGVVTTPAGCTPGVRTFTCLNNSAHTYTEAIPVVPHTHTVTYSQPAHGTLAVTAGGVSVASGTAVSCQTVLTVTATPGTGYKLGALTVNGTAISNGGTWTLTGGNATITASMSIITFSLHVSANPNGVVSPNGTLTVDYGSSKTISITSNAGYKIRAVNVDGVNADAVTSYTFNNITADHQLSADIAKVYDITATAGVHGQISPSGTVTVFESGNTSFTITPDAGYKVRDVLVDGVSVGALTSYPFTNVTRAHTIAASFTELTYTVTASASSGGSVSPSGAATLNYGQKLTILMTPDTGYSVYDVKVDGVSIGRPSTKSYTFEDNLSHTFAVEFRRSCTITSSDGGGTMGGSITPSGTCTMFEGQSLSFTAVPDDGYVIAYMIVDGIRKDGISSHIFTSVTSDHTILVVFTPLITASAGEGGSISPSGTVEAARSVDKVFSITPNAGYRVADVVVDGVSKGAIQSYTFASVTAPHTIRATFERIMLEITASAGTGGTITPAGTTRLAWGSSQQYVITPSAGYRLENVLVDGANAGTATSYAFSNISASHTIAVTFARITYRVRASCTGGGTITPAGRTDVPEGTDQTYTITPNEGFHIKNVRADADDLGAVGSYTFVNVTSPHDIYAEFERTNFNITFAPMTGGSIVAPAAAMPYESSVKLGVLPNTGYRVTVIKVDGVAITGTSFMMPSHDVTISAEFERYMYSVTVQSASHGTITASSSLVATGAEVSLTVAPEDGYRLASGSLKVNGAAISGTTFTMPAEDVTITAEFEIIPVTYTISPSSFGYTLGSNAGASLTCNGPYANYVSVSIDGSTLSSGWLTVSASGSGTSIWIAGARLDMCSAGSHTITVRFTNGSASAPLTVVSGGSGPGRT